jgi:pimeloyl-ACP methyl ester carboxylesterase
MKPISVDVIEAKGLPKIYHRGPSLNQGLKPAVFYFSLSGEESLNLDPYNQPAVLLANSDIRVFSLTLPGHEGVFPHAQAIKSWCEGLLSEVNIVDEFVSICSQTIEYLIESKLIDPKRIAAAGLSRGAYIATQLAAKDNRIQTVLGFAPLTRLEEARGIDDIEDKYLLARYSLENLIPELIGKSIRFYIGNYDTLVSTPHCFSFIHELSKKSYLQKRRFPQVELIIYPSIGHRGHGTPPEIFKNGAYWMSNELQQQ